MLNKYYNTSEIYFLFRYSKLGIYLIDNIIHKLPDKLLAEKKLLQYLLTHTDNKNNIVFDIGANRGYTVQHFIDSGYDAVAVEPDKLNFKALKVRYQNNTKVQLLNRAISDQRRKEKFFSQFNGGTISTIDSEWKSKNELDLPYDDSYLVDAVTLDDMIKKYGVPNLIKIDVEGAEYKVLKGLSHPIDVIIFEANLFVKKEATLNCISLLAERNISSSFSIVNSFKLDSRRLNKKEIITEIKKIDIKTIDIVAFK